MSQAIQYNSPVLTTFPTSPSIPARSVNIARFNQIVRMGFCLAGNPFVDAADIALKASWDARIAATDDTRIILSPPFSNSKIEMSKKIETGADTNETYTGLPIYFGEGTTRFSGTFNDVDPLVLDAFFGIVSQFSMNNGIGPANLVCFWVNKDGHIFSNQSFDGFPCINLTPRTVGSEGLNTSNKVDFDFYLPPNWDGGNGTPLATVPSGAGSVDVRAYPW